MKHSWHILGAGAIGGLFARRLHDAGTAVVLLSRQAGERSRPLRFIDQAQESTTTLPCETAARGAAISQLLVCTKAPGVLPALASVHARINAATEILIMVNGMGVGDQVRAQYPDNPIVIGTTTAACFRDTSGAWYPVAEGETHLGWLDQARAGPPDWAEQWQQAIPGFGWHDNVAPQLLAKLAVNAVINPATALFDVANGRIIEPPLAALSQQACSEVAAVLAHAGFAALSTTVQARVWAVAEATAANTSSMRADLTGQRPTEVEAILGYLLETLKCRADHPPATPLLDEWLLRLRHYESARPSPGT